MESGACAFFCGFAASTAYQSPAGRSALRCRELSAEKARSRRYSKLTFLMEWSIIILYLFGESFDRRKTAVIVRIVTGCGCCDVHISDIKHTTKVRATQVFITDFQYLNGNGCGRRAKEMRLFLTGLGLRIQYSTDIGNCQSQKREMFLGAAGWRAWQKNLPAAIKTGGNRCFLRT